jgi:hypothetical protein
MGHWFIPQNIALQLTLIQLEFVDPVLPGESPGFRKMRQEFAVFRQICRQYFHIFNFPLILYIIQGMDPVSAFIP